MCLLIFTLDTLLRVSPSLLSLYAFPSFMEIPTLRQLELFKMTLTVEEMIVNFGNEDFS